MSDVTDNAKKAKNLADEGKIQSKPKCGIIRPISAMGEAYPEKHWQEIADILDEVIKGAGFEPNLVSNGSAVDVIQTRIVQNLYHYPLVICDVSGANANVMFELGLRLAFDKATIIIKDRETGYNFDTSPIEHINYPRDLHYPSMIEFKHELRAKILSTFKAQQEKGYSPFLKHFGGLIPRKLDEKEVSGREYIEAIFQKITDKMDIIGLQLERQALWTQKQEETKLGEFAREKRSYGARFVDSILSEKASPKRRSFDDEDVPF